MKNFSIFLLFAVCLCLQSSVFAVENTLSQNGNYSDMPIKKTQKVTGTTATKQQLKNSGNQGNGQYLLKYNIDDLEAAPWLHSGQRKYDQHQ